MKKIDPILKERLATLIEGMGYEFVGGEITNGRQPLCRLYIDSPQGVTVDDCSKVSYQVSAMLDVEDPFPGSYRLEVSSPGIDRPLFEIEQFQKYVGSKIKIKLAIPIDGRKIYKGVLTRIEKEEIHLLTEDDATVTIPFSIVDKANLVGDIRL